MLWQGGGAQLPESRNGSVTAWRCNSFTSQKAQQRPACSHDQATTTGLAFGCFTTNKIADVLCIELGPVRLARLERLDQSTRIAKIMVPGLWGYAMNSHQMIFETS